MPRCVPRLMLCCLVFLFGKPCVTEGTEPSDRSEGTDALQIFEQRIMPIFRSPEPSSCIQCHLSSVDLKQYIRPSHKETFLALRQQGLIDTERPGESKILKLIAMGDRDADSRARRLHQKTRRAELDAFAAWIQACCRDDQLMKAKLETDASIGPRRPLEVVRHARRSRVVDSFARLIWSQRMRCFPCHTPHELDPDNPAHDVARRRHQEFVQKYGLKMNIFRETPEATLNQLIASSRRRVPDRYPLINVEHPRKSLLLLKPTSKVPQKKADGTFEKPSSVDPVTHMGGLKIHVNDLAYKSFLLWLTDYSQTVGDKYLSVEDLPVDNWIPTQQVLKLTDVPPDWGRLSVVQMFVHRISGDGGVTDEPIAFTQCVVTPRGMAVGPLSVFAGASRQQGAATGDASGLRPGRYVIRVCLDRTGRLQQTPSLLLGKEDLVGQTEVNAQWRSGFKQAEVISAASLVPGR